MPLPIDEQNIPEAENHPHPHHHHQNEKHAAENPAYTPNGEETTTSAEESTTPDTGGGTGSADTSSVESSASVETWRSWIVLVIIVLINFVTIGLHDGGIGVFTYHFTKEFRVPITQTSWIASIAIMVYMCSSPLGSMLVARIGCKWAVLVGAICSTLGFGLTAFCNQVWQGVLSYGILAAFGMSVVSISSVSTVAQYFDKHRQLAASAQFLGWNGGILFFPLICEELFKYLRYRDAMLCAAGIVACTFSGVIAFRRKEDPVANNDLQMEKAENATEAKQDEEKETEESPGFCAIIADHLSVLKKPTMLVYYLSTLLWEEGFSLTIVLLYTYIEVKRPHDETTPFLAMTIAGAAAFTANVVNILINFKWHPNQMLLYIVSTAGLGASMLSIGLVSPQPANLIISAAVWGLSGGLIMATWPSMTQYLNGKDHHTDAVAFNLFAGGIGAMTGPLIGAELQVAFGLEAAFYFGAACGITACGLMVILLIVKPSIWHPFIEEEDKISPNEAVTPAGSATNETSVNEITIEA